jgi:PilZ domain-containing protein
LKAEEHHPASSVPGHVDARCRPRFRLQVDITVRSRTSGVLKGYTVDISESGISAILRMEVSLGEIVELDFELPCGPVTILATVRQRNAFRYGFQFLDSGESNDAIRNSCRQLAVENSDGLMR